MAELLAVVGLVLVTSAACSLFEAVLYSVPASRIEALDRAGRPSGRILKRMRRHVDQPIAAVLSLNTIANTGGGAVAGALAGSLFGAAGAGVPAFSVAFTLAILLFSEVIPKTVGVVYARGLAPLVARPLQVLVLVFRPLVAVTQLATRLVWSGQHEPRMSDDELLTLVRLGLGSGDLRIDEARVIRNVLSLEKRTAADVMTPRPVVFTLAASVTAQEAAAFPELERFSRVPVHDDDDPEELVGLVHKVDILTAVARDRFDATIASLMRPVQFVVESAPLDRLLRTFLEHRRHLAAVIDEFGGFAGIVTLEDLIEELLGQEIVDESDRDTDLRELARRRRHALLGRGGA